MNKSSCSLGCRVNKHLYNPSGSRVNNIYSPGSDKLTEVHLYMSTSCQLHVNQAAGEKDTLFTLLQQYWYISALLLGRLSLTE